MKVRVRKQPKLCSVKVGDVVRLPKNDGTDLPDDAPIYMVCVDKTSGARAGRSDLSIGLYDEKRPLFLVDLRSGEATKMPHLSTRIEHVESATLDVILNELHIEQAF